MYSIIEDWKIPWSKTGEFDHYNHFILLIGLPLIVASIVIFRKQLRKIFHGQTLKNTMLIFGAWMIIWEFWFDVNTVTTNYDKDKDIAKAVGLAFDGGWDMCRLNMYVCGIALVSRRNWIMFFAPTAFFGGYSTMVDHYDKFAQMHSIITHSLLVIVPAFIITMLALDYKTKDVFWLYTLNLSYALLALGYNIRFNTNHAELSISRMEDNILFSWAPGEVGIFLWILLIMFLSAIWVFCYKLIWRLDHKFKGEWFGIDFAFIKQPTNWIIAKITYFKNRKNKNKK